MNRVMVLMLVSVCLLPLEASAQRRRARIAGVPAPRVRALVTALAEGDTFVSLVGGLRTPGEDVVHALYWGGYDDPVLHVARARVPSRGPVIVEARSRAFASGDFGVSRITSMAFTDVDGDAELELVLDLVVRQYVSNADVGDADADARRVVVLAAPTLAVQFDQLLAIWSEWPTDEVTYARPLFEDATGDGARDLVIERWSISSEACQAPGTQDGWALPPSGSRRCSPPIERVVHAYDPASDRFVAPQ